MNLFALFCSRGKVDEQVSVSMLREYLVRYFGIRNSEKYLTIYRDLRGMYDESEMDIEEIVDGICSGFKLSIGREEAAMVLLRLMEFCSKTPERFNPGDPLFIRFAERLNISDELRTKFGAFVTGRALHLVKFCQFQGFAAPVKTLWLPKLNLLVFSYDGDDAPKTTFNDVPLIRGMYQIWDTSGVLKSKSGKPVYYSMVLDLYTDATTKERITFTGRDIEFRFPGSDNGIHNFSFNLRGGELVAIMGGSGTGKTTLISILNGSICPQQGTLAINGHDINSPEAKALIGFVPQDDMLIEELTVYQNLYYTARLCFRGMPEQEIEKRVMKMLRNLGLEQARNLKVGSPIKKYISGGQRKRLNIALELIREPAVLLLDEPTSGLSSTDTETVISLLKEQTYHGCLVVTNIHQPSSDVYKLFDRLWLLDKGGYPVYDGNPIEAIIYFKTVRAYADADTSMCPVCGTVKPETTLNIIEERTINSHGRRTQERRIAPRRWHELYLNSRPPMDEPVAEPIQAPQHRHSSHLVQWWVYLCRNVRTHLANPQYVAITLLEAPLLALLCALLTHYTPPGADYTVMDNKNLVSYIFMAVIVATFIGMSQAAEEIIKDRALLKRERYLRLSHHSYIWSKIAYLAAVSAVQTTLFLAVGNPIMGLTDQWPMWWGTIFATAFVANLTGLLLSQTLASVVAIYITIPILLIPQILLSGLVVDFHDLTPNSTTGNVPVAGNVIPSRWAFEALTVTTYTGNEYERDLFPLDRQKFETQYYRYGVIPQLEAAAVQSPVPTRLLANTLPALADACHIPPYTGDLNASTSVRLYLAAADSVMLQQGNAITLLADKRRRALASKHNGTTLSELKRQHYNLALEAVVAGTGQTELCTVVGDHLVPRAGIIFLTHKARFGAAPFYSSVKQVAGHHVPTLAYNLAVLALMALLLIAALLYNTATELRNWLIIAFYKVGIKTKMHIPLTRLRYIKPSITLQQ